MVKQYRPGSKAEFTEAGLVTALAVAELRSEINLEKGSPLTPAEVSTGTSLILASRGIRSPSTSSAICTHISVLSDLK